MLIVYETQWNGYKHFREENHSLQELAKVLGIINNLFLTTGLQFVGFWKQTAAYHRDNT